MKNRKSNILNTSRKLFNVQGYSSVTIRMIAIDLKISSGNLNYHFKKREDILEALYFEMVSEFDQRIEQLEAKSISLENTRKDILSSMKRMVDYRFLWTDLYNILRSNKKIKAHFQKAHTSRIQGTYFLFDTLTEKGIMGNFKFESERQFLAERMIEFGNTWLYNSSLYDEKINSEYIEVQATSLLSMLHPYLTKKGKEEFKKLLDQ